MEDNKKQGQGGEVKSAAKDAATQAAKSTLKVGSHAFKTVEGVTDQLGKSTVNVSQAVYGGTGATAEALRGVHQAFRAVAGVLNKGSSFLNISSDTLFAVVTIKISTFF